MITDLIRHPISCPFSPVISTTVRHAAFVATCLALTACEQPAIDPSQSLVGSTSLPSARALNKEVIQIHYNQDKSLTRQLYFELRPDNSWSVAIFRSGTDVELSRNTTRVPKPRADALRRKLWRLRSEKLEGVEWSYDPADCPVQPTDTGRAVSVAFIREGSTVEPDDDQVGVFTLPILTYCNTPKGRAAHALLQEVMRGMPGEQLRDEYETSGPFG